MTGDQRHRLWWLTMGDQLHLSVLDRDLRVLTYAGLRLNEVTSYCLTNQGDLWACASKHWVSSCLLRRARDGGYSIATASGSVRFVEGWPETRPKHEGVWISAVSALPDETLLLAGRAGLYRLQGNELVQEPAFRLERPWVEGRERDRVVSQMPWTPNNVLLLDDGRLLGRLHRMDPGRA